jgi:hypothetical protein
MNKKGILLSLISLYSIAPAYGMNLKKGPTTRFVTNKDDIPGKIVDFLENKENKNIAMNALVITNPRVIKAINDRKNSVTGRVGGHYMTDFSKVPGLTRDANEHGKNFCSEENCLVSTANPSNSIYEHGNKEAMVIVEGDPDLAKTMYKQMTSTSPIKENKNIVNTTPKKNESFSSRKTRLNASRAKRILNVANRGNKNSFVYARTMNINDQDMTNALATAAKNDVDTRLLVNKSSLTKNGLPLLHKMHNAGVKIHVFDPQEEKRSIMHVKDIVTNKLYIIGNANYTEEGDKLNNNDTYFPNDKKLIKAAKKDFKKVEKESVPFKNAIELSKAVQEKKAAKRKLDFDAKKPATKKQKLITNQ